MRASRSAANEGPTRCSMAAIGNVMIAEATMIAGKLSPSFQLMVKAPDMPPLEIARLKPNPRTTQPTVRLSPNIWSMAVGARAAAPASASP